MKKRYIILGISLLVIVNLSALTTIGYHKWCSYREACHSKENDSVSKNLCQRLALSDSQREKMYECRASFCVKFNGINMRLQEKRSDLINLINVSKPDTAQILLVLHQINTMQAELQEQAVRNLLKEKEIFTPGQQERYISILKSQILISNSYQ